ncbi:MAG: cyclase family protein [Alphaproteobacteria bacterium]|nr:cyclase family protein [Alphaproteobacteria bacterium]
MRLVDLTRTLDSRDIERLPDVVKPMSSVLVPEVEYYAPDGRGAEAMCFIFGCERHHLPGGEGWGEERISMNSHIGTHVDAPLHYGSTCEGAPARTIEQIGLEELFCDGLVLDLRAHAKPGEGITVAALDAALAENGGTITPGCAVMLRTGQEKYDVNELAWYAYPGMTREGTLHLAAQGAKILGTDAPGWDRPFLVMRQAFHATGDSKQIWDGHFAGREREVFIVQQLTNLASLPPNGFKVGFFPIKLAHCSAAPARVVAFLP